MLVIFSLFFLSFTFANSSTTTDNCVKLNTNFPMIGDKICYTDTTGWKWTTVTPENAFPLLTWFLSKLLLWIIVAVSFLMVVFWSFLIIISWWDDKMYATWKWLIKKAVIAIILLSISGYVLYMINPNFFK